MSGAGIGAYIVNLVDYLVIQEDFECVLFTDKKLRHEFAPTPRLKVAVIPAAYRTLWEQFLLPTHISKEKLDLYHATWNYGLPVMTDCPSVLTIHDLIPLVLPEFFSSLKDRVFYRSVYKMSLSVSVRRARRILTDSESSKRDICRILGIPPSKIEAVPLGLRSLFSRPPTEEAVKECRSKYGLESEYVIYTGGFDRRKNIPALLAAFREVMRSRNGTFSLVLTGGRNFLCAEIEAKAQELGVDEHVVFTGHVPDEDMPALLRGAKALVYPSLYEGFGFPPLEAMACGTPVIASNVSAIPEIVADAGILVDPRSVKEITDAMITVLKDEELLRKLSARGLKRAQLFKAEDNARRTLAVYKAVLAQSPQTSL
jgi:glycosyltransferase involved in cell wall biosynthesis